MRNLAIIENGIVANVIVIPEGSLGDKEIDLRNGVELADLKVQVGWTYENGEFIAPPKTQEQLEADAEQLAKAEARSAAEAKLLALGLTTEDLTALLG